jgi:ATP-dependent DNA ligase
MGFGRPTAVYAAICAHGLEGVVAKKRSSRYRPGERGWIKLKNYWRRASETEAMRFRRREFIEGRAHEDAPL